jgi:ABC-type thiamine transport system ATPase subunit
MNVILYTTDFEPITVIDLPVDILEKVERHGILNLIVSVGGDTQRVVQVIAHKINWIDGSKKVVLTTEQEALALSLQPEWLTGQVAVVKAYRRTVKILTDKLQKLKGNNER